MLTLTISHGLIGDFVVVLIATLAVVGAVAVVTALFSSEGELHLTTARDDRARVRREYNAARRDLNGITRAAIQAMWFAAQAARTREVRGSQIQHRRRQ